MAVDFLGIFLSLISQKVKMIELYILINLKCVIWSSKYINFIVYTDIRIFEKKNIKKLCFFSLLYAYNHFIEILTLKNIILVKLIFS